MAGGIWTSQNKVRPGAYINFESAKQTVSQIGTRGIATMGLELNWGKEDELIELTAEDLMNGNSLAKVGYLLDDADALLPELALQNAAILKIYRLNKGGSKASYTDTDTGLTITAKCKGTFGNKIAILVTATGETGKFYVQTYADGYLVDKQIASTIGDLIDNEFVEFTGTAASTLDTISSTLLTGGTNGTMPTSTALVTRYGDYFTLLRGTKWNTLAILTGDVGVLSSVVTFIHEMREDEGKYVQAVISKNDTSIDYEGIINNINGAVINDVSITNYEFCAWVAGATAGALFNESLTGKVVEGATAIVGSKTSSEIVQGLENGQFLLSLNQDGSVKIEKDINSLHTFTEKSYSFSKNRVIREIDEIGSGIENIWETTYLGKVTNNTDGLTLFRSSIIGYLTELQNAGGIDTFDTSSVVVAPGDDIDSVVAELTVKPLDSMEFLYMTVNIQ